MPLNYAWYKQTFGAHPSTRADFEKYFDSSGRYSQVTFGGAGIYTGPLNFGTSMPNPLPSFLPTTNMSFKVEGYIYIPADGTYSFRSNGDDAIDIIIDGQVVAYWYGSHGFNDGTSVIAPSSWIGDITLTKGYHHFIGRFETVSGNYGMELGWKKPGDSAFYIIPNAQFNTEYISKVHASTPLPIKTCLSVDKDTMFLAHYDVTIDESLYGYPALSSAVATLRPYDGKYGGAVAIEEGTTNLADVKYISQWANSGNAIYTPSWTPDFFIDTPITYLEVIADGNIGNRHGSAITTASTVYSLSIWVWLDLVDNENGTFFYVREYSDANTNGGNVGTMAWYDADGVAHTKWSELPKKRWILLTANNITTATDTKNIGICCYVNKTGSRMYTAAPQIEQKAFATSFTSDTRPLGRLGYNINTMNPWDGSFSFSAWTKCSTSKDWRMIAGSWTKWYFSWYSNSDSGLRFSWRQAGVQQTIGPSSIPGVSSMKWNFVSFSYDKPNSTVKMYINGKLIATGTSVILDETGYDDFGLGTLSGSSLSYPLNGLIDEVRIDQRVVSDDEFEQWYLSQSPFFPKGVHRVYA